MNVQVVNKGFPMILIKEINVQKVKRLLLHKSIKCINKVLRQDWIFLRDHHLIIKRLGNQFFPVNMI